MMMKIGVLPRFLYWSKRRKC